MTIVRVFLYHKIGQDSQENDDPQAVAQDNCQPGKVKKYSNEYFLFNYFFILLNPDGLI